MNKTILDNIENYLGQMKLLILRSGIKEKQFGEILERCKSVKDLQVLHDDLLSLMGLEWREAYRIWTLPAISNPEKAEEIWARYEVLDIIGTPEQILLSASLKKLNNSMKEWMKCLPKKKKQ